MNEASPIVPVAAAELPLARPAAAVARIGVLLVNLGTPDAADAASVRRYLKEFLSDPRVIENQGPLWSFILNGIILRVRPRRKARDYRKIWNHGAQRIPAQDHHARPGRKARQHARALGRSRRGRLGDALRQSLDRVAARKAWWRRAASASW